MRFILLFLLIAEMASAEDFEDDGRFKCGLLTGCFQDFAAVGALGAGLIPALSAAAELPAAQAARTLIIEAEQKLEDCNRDVLNSCRVDRVKAEKTLDQKLRFLTDASDKPKFGWTDKMKKLHRESILRKLCSGSVSLESVETVDAILLFNTPCVGLDYFKELPAFAKIPGIENQKPKNNFCRPGWQPTTSLEVDGTKYSSQYLVITADSALTGILTPEGVINNLDSNLIHEFVHFHRDISPGFKKSTDDFLNIRFSQANLEYLEHYMEMSTKLEVETIRIGLMKGLTDKQRNGQIKKYLDGQAAEFEKWLGASQMPVNYGAGSRNGAYTPDFLKAAHSFKVFSYPEFVDGKAQEYIMTDNVAIYAGLPYGSKYTFDVDAYGLVNKEEYLAIALTAYRNDPKTAAQNYSAEELEWLQKNWKNGFLTQ